MTLAPRFVCGLEWLALFLSLPQFPHPIPVGTQFLAEEKGIRCYPCGLLCVLRACKRLLLFNLLQMLIIREGNCLPFHYGTSALSPWQPLGQS